MGLFCHGTRTSPRSTIDKSTPHGMSRCPSACDARSPCKLRLLSLTAHYYLGTLVQYVVAMCLSLIRAIPTPGLAIQVFPRWSLIRSNQVYCHCRMRPYPVLHPESLMCWIMEVVRGHGSCDLLHSDFSFCSPRSPRSIAHSILGRSGYRNPRSGTGSPGNPMCWEMTRMGDEDDALGIGTLGIWEAADGNVRRRSLRRFHIHKVRWESHILQSMSLM